MLLDAVRVVDISCEIAGWSDAFLASTQPTQDQCDTFNSARANIPSANVESITLFSSAGGASVTCSENALAVANAIRTGSPLTNDCDGNSWSVGRCGTDNAVEVCADCTEVCTCGADSDNSVTVRPCTGDTHWGGGGTESCNQSSQTLGFRYTTVPTDDGNAGPCHYVACGRSTAQTCVTSTCQPNTELHSVRCCSEIDLGGSWQQRNSNPPECGGIYAASTFGTDNTCYPDQTFGAASEICRANGGRLCRLDEIENDCTSGSGCGHDSDMLWSDSLVVSTSPSPSASLSIGVSPSNSPTNSLGGAGSGSASGTGGGGGSGDGGGGDGGAIASGVIGVAAGCGASVALFMFCKKRNKKSGIPTATYVDREPIGRGASSILNPPQPVGGFGGVIRRFSTETGDSDDIPEMAVSTSDSRSHVNAHAEEVISRIDDALAQEDQPQADQIPETFQDI